MNYRWLRGLLLLAVLVLATPPQADAHAYMERSTPLPNAQLDASPREIRIEFTESINAELSSIAVEDEAGRSIAGELGSEGDNQLIYKIPALDKGVYTVRWQVLSGDTHVTEDAFRFSVGAPMEAVRPSETISLDGANDEPEPSEAPPTAEAPPEPAPNAPEAAPTAAKPAKDTPPQPESESAPAPSPSVAEEAAEREAQPPVEAEAAPALTEEEAAIGSADPAAEVMPQAEPAEPPSSAGPAAGASSQQPVTAPEALGHDHHHHSASGKTDWRGITQAALRMLEIAAAVSIASFLFNRHVLWRGAESSMPSLFAKRHERLLLGIALAIAGASGGLHVWMLADQLSAFAAAKAGGIAGAVLSGTTIGFAAWMRPALAALLLALSFAPPRDERWAAWVQALAALGLISLFPLTGHAGGSLPAVVSHILHVGAAAVWFGGLIGVLAATSRHEVASLHWPVIDAVIRRFSRIAFVLIAATAATGAALSALRLPEWGALLGTAYGRIVLAKTALLLLAVVIGAFHRLAFIPRLTAAANGLQPADEGVRRKFVFGVRTEIVLALAALLLAGVLSTTAPPEQNSGTAEPVYWHVMGDKAHMSFRMDGDAEPQAFRLDVWLPPAIGAPVNVVVKASRSDGEAAVDVPFTFVSGGPDPYGFEGFDKFTYEAIGDYLPEEGPWATVIRIVDSTGFVHTYENTINVR